MPFEVNEGDEVAFECGSALANWRLLIGLVYVLFLRGDYLWLRRKEPNQTLQVAAAPGS